MATTADVDAAVATLASARVALAKAVADRAQKVTLRDTAAANLVAATIAMQSARDTMTAAKTNLLNVLAQTET